MARAMANGFNSDQLKSILNALPDAALIVDARGQILAANSLAITFFEAEIAGQHLTLALRAPAVLRAVNRAITQSDSSRVQHVIRTPVARTLNVHVAPMGNSEGATVLAMIVLRDLTHEAKIENMRADFVANASHELRTPLASLTGFIETMQGAAKNDPEAREQFLQMMKAQADRMTRLTDDLLSLSRIEIGEHLPPSESVDLTMIARLECELLAPVAQDAGCALRIDMPEDFTVKGDANQLSQVVHNLLENAIKYAGNGKLVEVIGDLKDNNAILSVRDHGPGIPAQHVPRLTERFYRVNVQDSRMRGGTGLGLAIVKHIINRHRGRLVIESKIGKGSTFSMHLPVH